MHSTSWNAKVRIMISRESHPHVDNDNMQLDPQKTEKKSRIANKRKSWQSQPEYWYVSFHPAAPHRATKLLKLTPQGRRPPPSHQGGGADLWYHACSIHSYHSEINTLWQILSDWNYVVLSNDFTHFMYSIHGSDDFLQAKEQWSIQHRNAIIQFRQTVK